MNEWRCKNEENVGGGRKRAKNEGGIDSNGDKGCTEALNDLAGTVWNGIDEV